MYACVLFLSGYRPLYYIFGVKCLPKIWTMLIFLLNSANHCRINGKSNRCNCIINNSTADIGRLNGVVPNTNKMGFRYL